MSVALLLLLAYKLDWEQVLNSAAGLAWWALPAAILLQALVFTLGNYRWWLLLATHKRGHRPLALLPHYFVGAFFNNLLPTSTGGDLFRIYHIYRQRHGVAIAASPVITERLIGLVTMISLATAVVPFLSQQHRFVQLLSDILPVLFVVGVVGLLLLGSRLTYRPLHNFFLRWERFHVIAAILRIAEASHTYVRQPGLVLQIVALSLFLQLLEVAVFWCLGIGVGSTLEVSGYLVMVPVVFVIAALPITVGGLGVREAAAVSLFPAVGMAEAHAGAISLFFIAVILISSFPGLLFFMAMKERKEIYKKVSEGGIST